MKKVYIVMNPTKELCGKKYNEIIDIEIVAVCTRKKEAEKILSTLNPFTAKIKESYIQDKI